VAILCNYRVNEAGRTRAPTEAAADNSEQQHILLMLISASRFVLLGRHGPMGRGVRHIQEEGGVFVLSDEGDSLLAVNVAGVSRLGLRLAVSQQYVESGLLWLGQVRSAAAEKTEKEIESA
jgi:hypothetical protein